MSMENIRGSLRGAAASRGIVRVRADGDPMAEIRNLVTGIGQKIDAQARTFEEFKAANDARLKDIEKGKGDVVSEEKVDRINADLTELGGEIDKLNAQLAALRIGGGNMGDTRASITPEQKAYRTAFSGKGGYLRRGVDARLGELAVKASLSSDSSPDGGYTVNPEIDTAIGRVQAAVSSMRQVAQVRTISSISYKKLVSQGGAASGWVEQRDSRTETTAPNLAGLDFPAKELYAMPAATQTLLDDAAVNIEAWLADEVGITFTEQEGASFITGDGTTEPYGLLSYTKVADASYAWGKLGYVKSGGATGFASSNPGDYLLDQVYALKQGYRANARWLMNRKTQGAVRKFKDQQDNYLWQPGATAGQPASLFGYPVMDDDNMPDLGAGTFPVAFGDFLRGYLIVDRVGVRVLRDAYTAKPYVLFYTTKRVGGGVQNFEAIKLMTCST